MDIETPFPVEGTVTPRENGYGASLPCASEWLSETENGDMLEQAVHEAVYEYGRGVEVRVRWTARHGICNGYELLGPVPEETDSEPAEAT